MNPKIFFVDSTFWKKVPLKFYWFLMKPSVLVWSWYGPVCWITRLGMVLVWPCGLDQRVGMVLVWPCRLDQAVGMVLVWPCGLDQRVGMVLVWPCGLDQRVGMVLVWPCWSDRCKMRSLIISLVRKTVSNCFRLLHLFK